VAFDARTGLVKWERTAGTGGKLAKAGTFVVVGGGDGLVRAFDLDTGDQRWCAPGGPTVASTGALAITGIPSTNSVVAYDNLSGAERWRADLGPMGAESASFERALVADASGVYVGLTDRAASPDVLALDLEGKTRWTYDLAACSGEPSANLPPAPASADAPPPVFQACVGGGTPSMILAGTRLIVEDVNAGALVALDTATGAAAWRLPIPASDGELRPQAADASVVIAMRNPRSGPLLVGLDASDGHELWSRPTGAFGIVMLDGSVVTVEQRSEGYTVTAIDSITAAPRWNTASLGSTYYPGAVAGSVLLPLGSDGLFALDAVTGDVRWRTAHRNPAQGGDTPDSTGYGSFVGDESVVVAVVTAVAHHEGD
jgi:outer membrane protein assembly factor BamB